MVAKRKVTFGSELRKARRKAKISLRKFAAEMGVSPTYVSNVENKEVFAPTSRCIIAWANFLQQDADKWLMMVGHIPPDVLEAIRELPCAMISLIRECRGLCIGDMAGLIADAEKIQAERKHA